MGETGIPLYPALYMELHSEELSPPDSVGLSIRRSVRPVRPSLIILHPSRVSHSLTSSLVDLTVCGIERETLFASQNHPHLVVLNFLARGESRGRSFSPPQDGCRYLCCNSKCGCIAVQQYFTSCPKQNVSTFHFRSSSLLLNMRCRNKHYLYLHSSAQSMRCTCQGAAA